MTKRNVLKPTLPRWDFRPWLLTKLAQRGLRKRRSTNLRSISGDRAGLGSFRRSTVTSNNRIPEPGLQARQLQ
ncbi:hypothetical protein BT93_A0935 [Corymbia citriodora subsp. variegata]|nr:hypothetical protein BT93_A0935 [Corymbia citriodora subsp. variegata]